MKIRNTYPKVRRYKDNKTGNPLWMVDARSAKWGMNERISFSSEKEALERARAIAEQVKKFGAHPEIPADMKAQANSFVRLNERLMPFGKTIEDAVNHFINFLGEEKLRNAKPTIGQLIDKYQSHKLLEQTGTIYEREIKLHCNHIKRTWGDRRIDDLRKNEIDTTLTKTKPHKGTRRKYLTHLKMFFRWAIAEIKDICLLILPKESGTSMILSGSFIPPKLQNCF